jgi:hypothetical protein
MHSQRQLDSLDVIGSGHVASGVSPVGPAPGVASRAAGQPTRQRDSLQASASLPAPARRHSHTA